MSTPDIDAFLTEVVNRIKAIDNGGDPLFSNVRKAPFLDMAKLIKIPRWPAAVVLDGSGNFNRFNRDIWTRTFSVAIIDCVARDNIGEQTLKSMHLRMKGLIDTLKYRTTDTAVDYSADEELEAVGTETDMLLYVVKNVRFIATFDRG